MRVAVFSTKPYDEKFFTKAAAGTDPDPALLVGNGDQVLGIHR